MILGTIINAIGGRAIRAILGGPLPTQEQLDAILAEHPLMRDHSTSTEQ